VILGREEVERGEACDGNCDVLNQIDPDFIRARTLKILDHALHKKIESGEFVLLGDDGVIREEKLLIETWKGSRAFCE
jgi:hypothetical protein